MAKLHYKGSAYQLLVASAYETLDTKASNFLILNYFKCWYLISSLYPAILSADT